MLVNDVNLIGGRQGQVGYEGGRVQLQGLGHRLQIVANPFLDIFQVLIGKTFRKGYHEMYAFEEWLMPQSYDFFVL